MSSRFICPLILLFLATSCITTAVKPRLDAAVATRPATAEARKKHYDFNTVLSTPTVRYDAKFEGGSWWVNWDQKPDEHGMFTVGGDFSALVNDKTGEVTMIPGR
jgi:hypothetical protein